ncbi:uncharacterized protein LOC141839403 [Curcuma longa]|uniref:uncharacterized protein LOC141839403 n=1 Tax=Curcuma longa TaxID=136217 RepID=UPI003D9E2D57
MAKLHKFKLLATQCAAPAAVASPSRSPAPSFRLRRRRTLLGLLGGGGGSARRQQTPGKPPLPQDRPTEKRALLSHSLADLFVASPPPPAAAVEGTRDKPVGVAGRSGFDIVAAGARGAGVPRFVSRSLRYRLLRRTWRPVLVAIPE